MDPLQSFVTESLIDLTICLDPEILPLLLLFFSRFNKKE